MMRWHQIRDIRVAKKTQGGAATWDGELGLYARTLIAVEMKKRGLTFRDLTEKLNATFNVEDNERNVRNKVARGTFSAAFMLECFIAMDAFTITLDESAKKAPPTSYLPIPD